MIPKMGSLTLIVAAILLSLSTGEVYKVPLTRRVSKMTRMINEGTWSEYHRKKSLTRATNPIQREVPAAHKVYEYDGLEYFGEINVGNPGQQFTVILDTGSGTLWFPDSTCDASTCDRRHRFESNKSRTYQVDRSTWYTDANWDPAAGFRGQDTVRFGAIGESQLSVPRTAFGQAKFINDWFADDSVDGVLGMGFVARNPSDDKMPVLMNAINQGLLDQPLFTVFLLPNRVPDGAYGGVFTYGGYDVENCGDVIVYQTITQVTSWEIMMEAVKSGSYTNKNRRGWYVTSETGKATIGAPKAICDQIAKARGAKWDNDLNVYVIDCGAEASMTLTIGGKDLEISSKNMIMQGENNKCWLALEPYDDEFAPTWWLGIPLIREYCHIYDIAEIRIGFAAHKQVGT